MDAELRKGIGDRYSITNVNRGLALDSLRAGPRTIEDPLRAFP